MYLLLQFFRKLNSQIENIGADLGFPPKKFIGNAKKAFIKQRMLALQVWILVLKIKETENKVKTAINRKSNWKFWRRNSIMSPGKVERFPLPSFDRRDTISDVGLNPIKMQRELLLISWSFFSSLSFLYWFVSL